MNSFTTLIKGARLIVETCMTVKEGDSLLVIADEEHRKEAQAIAGVAVSVGARPVIADVTPQVVACLADVTLPMEPPPHLAAAMVNSTEILIITNLEWANRFAHVNPVRAAVDKGAKIASIEPGMGSSWAGMTLDDIRATVGRAERIMAAMVGADWVHVTSPAGTDVRINIEGRPPLKVIPIEDPGVMMGPIPIWGEVAYAAVETKTEGVIVYDGIMLGVGAATTLPEPIRLDVREGRVVGFAGGAAADSLRRTIEGSDSNGNIVAEFAIGTSERSPFGTPSEKGKLSTVHFGLGDNAHAYPGGQSYSKYHLDGSVRNVSIEVGGRWIMREGKLLI